MTLPAVCFGLIIGTALAGVLYMMYRQHEQGQYSYSYRNEPPIHDFEEPVDECLPRRRRSVSQSKKCSICLDSLANNVVELRCKHSFHRRCIDSWFVNQRTCPNCRTVA